MALDYRQPKEKIEALAKLSFPANLEALEHYLGLTGWLCNKIPYYAQKAEPLQCKKALLLKGSTAIGGKQRKGFTKRTPINKIPVLLESFCLLQGVFPLAKFPCAFQLPVAIYVDIDASKEREFGVHVYHVKDNLNKDNFAKTDIMSILFLSKSLNGAESRY